MAGASQSRSVKTVVLLVAVLGLAGGIVAGKLWQQRASAPVEIAGFVYPQPKPISPFALIRQDGSSFGPDALEGKWTFMYFGYTFCPDACPTTLVELNRVAKLLAGTGPDADTQFVFVSVDPRRDTPERLAEYVPYFNRDFIGVTGSDDALRALTGELGVIYVFPEGTQGDTYPVDHSSNVLLLNPDGRLHAVFTAPQKAQEVAGDFRKIRERWH